jgi:hypothetical protein
MPMPRKITRTQGRKAKEQLVLVSKARTQLRIPPRPTICQECHRPFLGWNHQRFCPPCRYTERSCRICQRSFRAHRSDSSITCSPSCSKVYRSQRQQGAQSHRWQGGKTAETILRRTRKEYTTWRSTVFARNLIPAIHDGALITPSTTSVGC